MSSSVSDWLKLNKLLDQYSREGRDITVTISYNIRWDSIILNTFQSSNSTAIHYAAIALPKILSFPSALVIFSSLEKSSLLLGEILAWLTRELGENNRVSGEVKICSQHLTQHYSQLQNSSPNIRRVCSVFCENLLEVSVLLLYQGKLWEFDCNEVRGVMVSALFHTSLLEDYTNLFHKKHRKTEHVQKLFSVLTRLGDSPDPLTLESYYKFLPELVSEFFTAFNEFQTSCKQFSLLAFNQFITGLRVDTAQSLTTAKLECLSVIIEKLEFHLSTFPNDPDLSSAETETFSRILSLLMDSYHLYPDETSRCMANIQRINHSLLEVILIDIFRIVFTSDVYSKLLLNSVFEIYSKLNQLDKLVSIIIAAAGKVDRAPILSMVEFKNVTQKYLAMSSLNTCNKCLKLLLEAVVTSSSQTSPGLVIQADILRYILCVSPIGDLNANPTHRNEFLQLLHQLYSLIQSSDTIISSVHIICYFTILDAFIFSLFITKQLPLWKDSPLASLQALEIQLLNEFIIPTKWLGKWEEMASDFDGELLKRLREIQIGTLITLSRFSQPTVQAIPLSPSHALELLSNAVERYLTCETTHFLPASVLQFAAMYFDKLSYRALLRISQQVIRLETNPDNTDLLRVVYSEQFKEIRLLHPYLSYAIMSQIFDRMESYNSHKLAKEINQKLYSNLNNKLDSNLEENLIVLDNNSIFQELENLLTADLVLRHVNTECSNEILYLLQKFEIVPLSCLSLQLKLDLFLGMEVLLVLLAAETTLTEQIISICATLMRGINSTAKTHRAEVLKSLSTLVSLTKCIYRIAIETNLTTDLCYEVFSEISLFLFHKNKQQYASLANYATQLCQQISQANNSQFIEIQLELTHAIISCCTKKPENATVTAALNELVETTTPILLRSLSGQGLRGRVLRLLSANLTYIVLSNKSEQSEQIEGAISIIVRQVVKLIQKSRIEDVTAVRSLISISNTLKQHNYSLDIQISKVLSLLSVRDLECGVQGSCLNREYIVGWIGCSEINNFREFLSEIIDRVNTEFVSTCQILCLVVEGKIPNTHHSEIRKLFPNILSCVTEYLSERDPDVNDMMTALRLVNSIFKLPSRIGLSSRSVVAALTCLSLASLADTPDTLLPLFRIKSSSLHYMLRNYPDCAISCIPAFLLLTKELIRVVFSLPNETEFPVLLRLLESYTALPPLANYTHHLIQQFITTAQECPEKQTIKRTLKPSILALIGFSKPETLLSLQAQLDTNGRAFYKEMRQEYDKFYRFKGRT